MNQHLMIDMETLGQTPDCVVLSLGACFFNQQGVGEGKEWTLSVQAQINNGRKISAQTLAWWMQQSPEARAVIAKACNEPNSVGPTMQDFTSWVMKNSDPTKLRVWSCGANFDTVILEHLLGQLRLPVPYSFWNVRCYRTLKSMFQIEGSRAGVAHRALDDAKHQAHWAAEYLKKHPECDR